MTDEGTQRRLAAILFTDIVGYTALMAESEAEGRRVRELHREIVTAQVSAYGGRCIEARGDESLSIFASTLDSVNCALAILEAAAARDGLRLHAGIHLGDVVLQHDEVSGDGVNIAARLCSLSDGDGVFVSEEVRQAVRNQPHVRASPLGPQEFKNVLRPVDVHVLRGVPTPPVASGRGRRWRWAAAAVLLLCGVLWLGRGVILGRALDGLGMGIGSSAPSIPEGPSLAVLPFAGAGDASLGFLADGITDDLTTEFMGVPHILVVSRNSAFAYRGRDLDVQQVGRELGVRYVVRGSVRADGDRVRVTAELTNASTGYQVWSERYDRVLADVLALQAEIAEEILEALSIRLEGAELERIRAKPTDDLTAYEAAKRAQSEFYHFRKESNARARRLFERAIEIDPGYAQAYALLANTYNYEYTGGWNQDPQLLDRAEALVREALALDPASPEAHTSLAAVQIARGHWSDAAAAASRAVELAPSYDFAHFLRGMASRGNGQILVAFESLRRGMRLDPRGQAPTLSFLADLNYRAGRVEEAVAEWERIRRQNPDHIATRLALADHYEREGRADAARTALGEILQINPDYRADRARGPGGRYLSEEDARRLDEQLARLRASGE